MAAMPFPLIFIRHGETEWNQQNRFQGTTDTELSHQGAIQALENADRIRELASHVSIKFSDLHFVSSPLLRAQQTASLIRDELCPGTGAAGNRLPAITIDPAFRELSLGRWEGLTSAEVKDQFYLERKSRKADRWTFAPMDGESMASRKAQVVDALQKLQPGTIVITHSGILRIILHVVGGLPEQAAARADTPHDQIAYWNSAKMHTFGQNG